jgi:putative ABC transport system permease protein
MTPANTARVDRPPARRPGNGGTPARRALIRWSWRLFRREWRQQLLVLVLLTVAVAATTFGIAIAGNGRPVYNATFGTANYALTWPGSDRHLAADLAYARQRFGPIEVIAHQNVKIPGSLNTIDLRAESPRGRFGYPLLRLDAGRYPVGPDQVAVTAGVAAIFGLRLGSRWLVGGHVRRVVGIVENPQNLLDEFALVPPGQIAHPNTVTALLRLSASRQINQISGAPGAAPAIQSLPGPSGFPAIAVLVFATIGLLFVGLVSIAGFAVMAGRRLRALGMLGAIGATARHTRLVMIANGLIVGLIAATAGLIVGLAGWLAALPKLQTLAEHRIPAFHLPWADVAAGMLLAILTAVTAAWWPARTCARVPITAALSGRPPRPQPGRRFAALGGALLAAGLVLLLLAKQHASGSGTRPAFDVAGLILTPIGLLLLGPLAIRMLAAAGRRAPIGIRLALRDLVRYQARSGAALGAIALALGICAAIAISTAAAAATQAIPPKRGNLPPNELMVYLTAAESPSVGSAAAVPALSGAELTAGRAHVAKLATMLRAASPLGLDVAVAPSAPTLSPAQGGPGQQVTALATVSHVTINGRPGIAILSGQSLLYVATPAVLRYYGITPAAVKAAADLLTGRGQLAGDRIIDFAGARTCPAGVANCQAARPPGSKPGVPAGLPALAGLTHPVVQTIAALPAYTSAPDTLITMHAVRQLKLNLRFAAWLIRAPHALTPAQLLAADRWATRSGLTIETRNSSTAQNLSKVATESAVVGVLLAIGVLAMTIGLIRSETAGDVRTLAATGSSGRTRRTLTAATAGSLALLAALLGVAGCYLALIAWNHGIHPLTHVPYVDLAIMLVGLPVLATTGGWLLAGREPTDLGHQAMA